MIAVIDSGVGGLSVYLPLRSRLPEADILYLADAQFAPYGIKSREEITRRLYELAGWLVSRGVRLLVLACNTATVNAIEDLRRTFPSLRIVGIEPAIKPAAEQCDRIVVLGTQSTVENDRYQALVARYAEGKRVWNVGAPELVRQVEAGRLTDPTELDRLLNVAVREPEAVVIGCTHFSFLKATIHAHWPQLEIFDGADGVVAETVKWASMRGLLPEGEGRSAFFTTGPERTVQFVSPPIVFHHVEIRQ